MKFLLDTHVAVWWFAGSKRLGNEARRIITTPDVELFFSAASWWELAIKAALGRLDFDLVRARQILQKNEIAMLAVTFDHGDRAAALAEHHKDPFDRMLVAQAMFENLRLLTRDTQLKAYGPSVLCV
ncbi:MAG TPA: type II toxin-antitoxin system VapC family toxin [Rhizomicrobium sp.]